MSVLSLLVSEWNNDVDVLREDASDRGPTPLASTTNSNAR